MHFFVLFCFCSFYLFYFSVEVNLYVMFAYSSIVMTTNNTDSLKNNVMMW